ncbi:tRNA (adenosine(37)-N6)-threonylcarbamoyltransferase complex ATPase subunit type 1 TsaE [Paucidesulfovibrio longus]|uniref:tRNA (adenosine(37)-N6)-threonylcarbamoyltransferase complex ATPase subunit type 1 TsaE n=1 Tax=Paucidesulfovibrio longus TaxID=889 RepID=UPI0003FEA938|nr:tRNA (adenosine(37)-N6)-threonylcarbamoyltransferase complex ATPase subunit type 1 TsaE [Paucidesulfovibrio longus]
MTLHVELEDLASTLAFGRKLASAFAGRSRPPALLLTGGLGAGKTTLIRALVESLPGADQAEVTSPSFNIVNIYPTNPPVAHFDLYRLADGCSDDDIFELLESETTWNVVEWADRLAPQDEPQRAVHIALRPSGTGRTAQIKAKEKADEATLRSILEVKEG